MEVCMNYKEVKGKIEEIEIIDFASVTKRNVLELFKKKLEIQTIYKEGYNDTSKD